MQVARARQGCRTGDRRPRDRPVGNPRRRIARPGRSRLDQARLRCRSARLRPLPLVREGPWPAPGLRLRRATVRPTCSRRTTCRRRRRAAARRWRSSTRSTIRPRSPISRTYRSTYGLPPCTTANGCFKKVNQTAEHALLPPPEPGLGPRDLARPRHGQRRLPELPHPPRRGDHEPQQRPRTRRWTPPRGSARTRSATATAAASRAARPPTTCTSTIRASRSPRARATTATASRIPAASRYVTAVGGTSLTRGGGTPRLDRDGVERRRQRLQRVRGEAVVADGLRLRTRARSPTSRPSPTRTPASPCSTAGLLVHGRRHERVVADHRGRLRARRQRVDASTPARTRTRTRAACST